MKKLLFGIIIILVVISLSVTTVYAIAYNQEFKNVEETQKTTEVIEPSFDANKFYAETLFEEFEYIELNTKEHCLEKINEYTNYIEFLRKSLNSLLPSEYEEVQKQVHLEIEKAELLITQYQNDIVVITERMRWETKKLEYPEATEVWLLLTTKYGFSNEVAAGIMGNIMAEIAGGTLNFSGWKITNGALGMFQWLGNRKISIKKIYGDVPTIENQLEFMYDELYGTDGVTQQVKDWQRDDILNSKTPEEAAKWFCIWFERPNGGSSPRQRYAHAAYEYFMN